MSGNGLLELLEKQLHYSTHKHTNDMLLLPKIFLQQFGTVRAHGRIIAKLNGK